MNMQNVSLLTSQFWHGYGETNKSVFLIVVVSATLVASKNQKELEMEKWQFDIPGQDIDFLLDNPHSHLLVVWAQGMGFPTSEQIHSLK